MTTSQPKKERAAKAPLSSDEPVTIPASKLGISLILTDEELEELEKIRIEEAKAALNLRPMIFI